MKYWLLLIATVCFLGCNDENEIDSLNTDLLAYFSLDSSYADASGNDHLLQAYGTPKFTEGYSNEPSTAIELDGEDDYLVGSIGKVDAFSISIWLQSYNGYVDEWPKRRSTVFDYSNKQVHGTIDGFSGATQMKCDIDTVTVAEADIYDVLSWFHVYIAVGEDVKVYIDGSLKETAPLQETISYMSDIIYFGRASEDEELELTHFYGKMDEIKIYNRILDQSEIDEISTLP